MSAAAADVYAAGTGPWITGPDPAEVTPSTTCCSTGRCTVAGDLDGFAEHAVTVRTATGTGGMGSTWADPAPVSPVLVDEKRRLVRGPDAAQVVSDATLYDEHLDRASLYTPGSLVTLPSGRDAAVIAVAVHTSGGLDLGDHVEVSLT